MTQNIKQCPLSGSFVHFSTWKMLPLEQKWIRNKWNIHFMCGCDTWNKEPGNMYQRKHKSVTTFTGAGSCKHSPSVWWNSVLANSRATTEPTCLLPTMQQWQSLYVYGLVFNKKTVQSSLLCMCVNIPAEHRENSEKQTSFFWLEFWIDTRCHTNYLYTLYSALSEFEV